MNKHSHTEVSLQRGWLHLFPVCARIVCICGLLALSQYAKGGNGETTKPFETAKQMLDVLRPYCDMGFIGAAKLSDLPVWDGEHGKWMARFETSDVFKGPTGVIDVEVGESMKSAPVYGADGNIQRDDSWRTGEAYYIYCKGDSHTLRISMLSSLPEWNAFKEMILGFTASDLERTRISYQIREKYAAKRNLVIQNFLSGKLTNDEYMRELQLIQDAWSEEARMEIPPSDPEY